MGKPLRVLVAEDDEADFDLLTLSLSRGEFDVTALQVQDPAAFAHALSEQAWDIVISDYVMPHFSVPEALRLLRESGQDLPFIVVSGAIGEDTAVTTMRAGAHDYLMKDNLVRLVPAVERELLEAEIRRERRSDLKALRDSEERYREMVENMSSGVAVYEAVDDGADFVFVGFNASAERAEGLSRSALLGRSLREVFPGVNEMGLMEVLRRVWQTGESEYLPPTAYQDEHRFNWKENFVYRLSTGQVVAIFDDVTERVATHNSLHETAERLRAVIEASPVAIVMLNPEGRVLLWNAAAERTLGWTEDEVLDASSSILPEATRVLLRAVVDSVKNEGSFADLEVRVPRKDGSEVPVSISAGPVHDPEGDFIGAMSVMVDITERTQAAQLLRASEQRFRMLYEEVPVPYQSLDENGNILEVNQTWLSALGYERAEVIGRSFTDFLVPAERPQFPQRLANCKSADVVSQIPWTMLHKAGSAILAEFEGRMQRSADGQHRQSHLIFQDVTVRKRAEEALAAERERLAVTLRSIGDCVIATHIEAQVVLMSEAAEKLTGWTQEEAAGSPIHDIVRLVDERTGEPCPCPVIQVTHGAWTLELPAIAVLISRSGERHRVAYSAAPIRSGEGEAVGMVLVLRDTTEEQRLLSEALRVQKLESLSLLAGGIAHDFNNVLLVIMGNLQVARLFPRGDEKHAQMLNNAERACKQAQDLTGQLLTFAKGGAPVKQVASIAGLVRDSAFFAVSGSNVQCEFSADDDLWPVEVDVGQMSQVINNLVINADQAMPAGGALRVSLHNVTLDERSAMPLPSGQYVAIAVQDEGTGISADHLDHIFDPYFTTKSTGSGLGLANCYSIIRQHGGHIAVSSKVEVGSIFTVYLPRTERPGTVHDGGAQAIPTGSGRILIMDDEAAVRELGEMLLQELGYTVETVACGEEAVASYRAAFEASRPFAAVILDLTIRGGMGGKETIAALRDIDPDVKAIVCSGYSADAVMAHYRDYGFQAVVVKPYEVAGLAQAVAAATAGGRQADLDGSPEGCSVS